MRFYDKIVILLILLILTGCSSNTSTSDNGLDTDIHKGTEGMVINIIEVSPPTEITLNSAFQIGLELKNVGATDIKQGEGFVFVKKRMQDLFEID